jgi:hypothetical protein
MPRHRLTRRQPAFGFRRQTELCQQAASVRVAPAAENDDSTEVDKSTENESNQRREIADDIRITLAARRGFWPIYMLN